MGRVEIGPEGERRLEQVEVLRLPPAGKAPGVEEIVDRLERMTLPAHWAMFYMGGHLFGGPYIDCGNGLWKVRHILHTHSVVFHKRV